MRTPRHARPHRPRGRILLAVGILAAAILIPAGAWAAPTCTFDAPTATVTVAVGNGETATIGRTGDAITLGGSACGSATVTTTDAIVVNATGIPTEVVIDLSGGGFSPGLTTETDGDPEIEFTINLPAGSPVVRIAGSAEVDTIVAGAAGINLNASEAVGDADVLLVGLPTLVIQGAGGDDHLSVTGGSGTGAASTARLDGGAGDDLLLGAAGGNTFEGGDGVDLLNYAAATQLLEANLATGIVQHTANQLDQVSGVENLIGSPEADVLIGDDADNALRGGDGPDRLAGGPGDDTMDGEGGVDTVDYSDTTVGVTVNLLGDNANGDGADVVKSIENVTGSAFGDRLIGDGGSNLLEGLAGNDVIDGAGGDDTIDGGADSDTADFGLSEAGVEVFLGKGTATGAGADTLVDIENAMGTSKSDALTGGSGANALEGLGGGDTIRGRDGADDILGGGGRDLLFGQKGNDDLAAGSGNDQLDGGKGTKDVCHGGPGADSFVSCEGIKVG